MKSKKIIAIILIYAIVTSTALTGSIYKTYTAQNELESVCVELEEVRENYRLEVDNSGRLTNELNEVKKDLDAANIIIKDFKNKKYELVYLGEHKLTHYCNEKYEHICGNGDGLTAIGTQTTVGKTAAVDPSKIPYGSQIYIEGYGWRTAEDCGSDVRGNQIDILVDTHSEAYAMGVKSGGVWMLVEKS